MAQTARVFPFRRRAALTGPERERQSLLEEMNATRQRLSEAYTGFNHTGDPDLIEFYVYEINALQSRYSYLLRQVRELALPAAQG